MKGVGSRGMMTLALALALVLPPASAVAEGPPSTGYSAVTGIGAGLCTLVYAPLKLARVAGGTVASGLALLFTLDPEAAGHVFRSSVGGDYVVTPAHLEGRREFRLRG